MRHIYLFVILKISPGVSLNIDATFTTFESLGSELILSNGAQCCQFKPSYNAVMQKLLMFW